MPPVLDWVVKAPSSHDDRPLVLLLPWMWASRKALDKHVALYAALGCDVAIFRWSPLSVWLPWMSSRNGAVLFQELSKLPPRPIVLASYSGAAKGVLSALMTHIVPESSRAAKLATQPPPSTPAQAPAAPSSWWGLWRPSKAPPSPATPPPPPPAPPPPPPNPVRPNIAGLIFDSGPVDFESSVGVRLLTSSGNPWLRSFQRLALDTAAASLNFLLYEFFERERRAMWATLRGACALLHVPTLFLYSWAGDSLANPLPIHQLASQLRVDGSNCCCTGSNQQRPHCCGEAPGTGVDVGTGVGSAAGAAAAAWGGAGGRWEGRRAGPGDRQCAPGFAGMGIGAGDGAGKAREGGAGEGSELLAAAAVAATAPASLWPALGASTGSSRGCGGAGVGGGGEPGPLVVEQAWANSPHVGHLRCHGEDYRASVGAFLGRCRVHREWRQQPGVCCPYHVPTVEQLVWATGGGHAGGAGCESGQEAQGQGAGCGAQGEEGQVGWREGQEREQQLVLWRGIGREQQRRQGEAAGRQCGCGEERVRQPGGAGAGGAT